MARLSSGEPEPGKSEKWGREEGEEAGRVGGERKKGAKEGGEERRGRGKGGERDRRESSLILQTEN